MFINYCGQIFPADTAVIRVSNRAFNYGESLFETVGVKGRSATFLDAHHDRLIRGARLLKMDISNLPGVNELQTMINNLLAINQMEDAVIRWQVFREGSLLPEAGKTCFSISCRQSPPPAPEEGINICIYREAKKSPDSFSEFKHGNYLPYCMGALYAGEKKMDDAIILNSHGRICDSCMANIFIIRGQEIFTPALTEGCIAGIYRNYLIRQLPGNGINIIETAISEDMLMEADEVFLTNSVRGILPARAVEEKKFSCVETKKIISRLAGSAVA